MTFIRSIVFDIDGTLADRDTHHLLPGVREWFDAHASQYQIALATNQGGVGLRYWMESGGFGDPEKFPDEDQAYAHIAAVNNALPGGPYPAYVCFAYQSKKSGKWAPTPPDCDDDPEWDRGCRKPAPGLIFRAIRELKTHRAVTAMVGDSSEDFDAALNAGIQFVWSSNFFAPQPDRHVIQTLDEAGRSFDQFVSGYWKDEEE